MSPIGLVELDSYIFLIPSTGFIIEKKPVVLTEPKVLPHRRVGEDREEGINNSVPFFLYQARGEKITFRG